MKWLRKLLRLECSDEVERLDYRVGELTHEVIDYKHRLFNTRQKLHMVELELKEAKQEILKYRQSAFGSSVDWDKVRQQREEATQRARDWDAFHGDPLSYEDIMRTKEALEDEVASNRAEVREREWEKIRKAYKDNIRRNHPDTIRAKGGDDEAVRIATHITQTINAKYEADKERYGK